MDEPLSKQQWCDLHPWLPQRTVFALYHHLDKADEHDQNFPLRQFPSRLFAVGPFTGLPAW